MEENKIKSYEVYCRNFSQVIQAESIIMAMGEFWSANPTEEIITVENIEARNEAKPLSSAESKEAIPDAKTVFDKHYEIYRNLEGNPPIPLQAKNTILDAMHDYDSMFEKLCNNQRKMIDKRDEAIKDLQHQLTQLTTSNEELQQQHTESLLLYQNMCDQITKDQKQLEEVRKERDYYKALAEGYKKLLKRYEDDKQKNQ